jgi:NhaP-type Na+/H+ and K+/H+ antiporters
VQHTSLITNIALSFITFSVGGSLLFSRIKRLGKSIIYITVFEAELAFAVIAIGFFVMGYFFALPTGNSIALLLSLSLLMGSLGSPTDPSATLAITHEYRAKGDVSSTIMGVAAFDDVFGIPNYTIAAVIAGVLITGQKLTFNSIILGPLVIILGAVILGVVLGFILNSITYLIDRETEGALIVVIFSILLLCFGLASLLGFDALLSTMAMGATVANFNKNREKNILHFGEIYGRNDIRPLLYHQRVAPRFLRPFNCPYGNIFFVLFRTVGLWEQDWNFDFQIRQKGEKMCRWRVNPAGRDRDRFGADDQAEPGFRWRI